ncbi:hypothetical protein A4H97_18825 [Niastella yeongjuensis]|uniref:Uncharacterized protein n=1 Tax=Niastella yeongjuensis TaxID=354355 RepID=A0A1V9DY18_9BACT|nr:hypothetical protein [Niastella yeongjuensis]OQP38773.1 hypothetical protein A4H97_18825 [Niastella yeongjuensis]SEO33183.1 hypothetical protein SAMN05660816_02638 [Niastella yeongjuensis]
MNYARRKMDNTGENHLLKSKREQLILFYNMGTYTFIMDYLSGTYISQIEAIDKELARDIWIKKLEVKEIESFTIQDKEEILRDNFSNEEITPIKGMKSVWFFMVKTKSGNGYVNIIKTKL